MKFQIASLAEPRVSFCGTSGILFEAEGPLSLQTQERIWSLADEIQEWAGVVDVQPEMNNLLTLVDPLQADVEAMAARILAEWPKCEPKNYEPKILELGAVYGGEQGIDMPEFAAFHGLTAHEIAKVHAATEYVVFGPDNVSGYGYLFGMDPKLSIPRRKTPLIRSTGATICIGGAQTALGTPLPKGTKPGTVPMGWYVVGMVPDAPVPFDLSRTQPMLLTPGDRIRFRIDRVET